MSLMKLPSIVFYCLVLHFQLCRRITLAKCENCWNITQLTKGIPAMPIALSLNDLTLSNFQSGMSRKLLGGKLKNRPKLSGSKPKTRPNIMIIMADDVGIGDISGIVHTPNIDKLAQQGLSFNNAHATPLCAPSRYSLLSGNYQHRGKLPGGMWQLENGNNFRKGQISVAKVLRDGGNYNTNIVGKWHLGGKIPPNGNQAPLSKILTSPLHNWTLPLQQGARSLGFQSSYVTNKGIQGPPYAFFRDDFLSILKVKNWKKGRYDMPHGKSRVGKNGQGARDWDSTAYNMILVKETEKFLDKHMARNTRPFFSYVALGAAHVPHTPPYKYIDGSRIAKQYQTRHLDMLLEMDKTVGSIIKALEDRQLVDNTLIIFLSDNGGLKSTNTKANLYGHYSNADLRGNKGDIYEGGHRIPLIMRYDGVLPAGQGRKALISITDMFATVCDIAGVKMPEHPAALDSISFADFAKKGSKVEPPRNFLYISRYIGNKLYAEAGITKHFKLVHFLPSRAHPGGRVEYYHLLKDPKEEKDLSKIKLYSPEIERILNLMICENRPDESLTTCPTNSPTLSPTTSPTAPTSSPTISLTNLPTLSPTTSPTDLPTSSPTISSSDANSLFPTNSPTNSPMLAATNSPTKSPTSSTKLPSISNKVSISSSTMSPTNSPTLSTTISHMVDNTV